MDIFNNNMLNLGYYEVSKRFLAKMFNNIEINISRHDNNVESITAYQNGNIVDIPQDILNEVQIDINNSL